MSDWWKNPVLQGPENDYGQYDYLIEELPRDYATWEFSRYTGRCDCCGKERHWLFRSVHHFYTLDGYDSMDHTECWVCMLGDKIWSIKRRIKKKIKIVKDALELTHSSSTGNFKYWYKFAKRMYK